jgi:lipopolysaccharide biosynthesis glycosyltransferase
VAFACDWGYAPILGVALQSLLDHVSPDRDYEIIILWPDARGSAAPPTPAQEALFCQVASRENVRLRFVDMASWLAGWGYASNLPIRPSDHVSVACYYRLFLPSILADYQRVIYLDVDLILQTDVAKLWAENLGGFALGAVRDVWAVNVLRKPRHHHLEWINYLGVDSPNSYFNSGVMLFDLNQMRLERLEELCLNHLLRFPPCGLHDQDVLNAVCQHYTAPLHPAWNCTAWWEEIHDRPNAAAALAPDLLREYQTASKTPRIIHYLNRRKPWQPFWRDKPLAAPFWEIARRTPFAEQLERWPERRAQ